MRLVLLDLVNFNNFIDTLSQAKFQKFYRPNVTFGSINFTFINLIHI